MVTQQQLAPSPIGVNQRPIKGYVLHVFFTVKHHTDVFAAQYQATIVPLQVTQIASVPSQQAHFAYYSPLSTTVNDNLWPGAIGLASARCPVITGIVHATSRCRFQLLGGSPGWGVLNFFPSLTIYVHLQLIRSRLVLHTSQYSEKVQNCFHSHRHNCMSLSTSTDMRRKACLHAT
jgi:hypothetical protein